MPCILLSCVILCIAQSSVAWYLPSLQPFLEDTFQLTTVATGAMFTVEGATYAAFSPLWGWLLDKWVSPWIALYTGTICVIIGYCLLGPSPFLPFIPENVYVVGFALSIMGWVGILQVAPKELPEIKSLLTPLPTPKILPHVFSTKIMPLKFCRSIPTIVPVKTKTGLIWILKDI